MTRLFPLLALLACNNASDTTEVVESPPDGTPSPTVPTGPGTTPPPDAPWFCTDEQPQVTDLGVYQQVETAHYTMMLAVTPERAIELGRFAEAAYLAMADHFGAEPADLPLEVGLYPDQASFEQAITDDGVPLPGGGAGGYYHPTSKQAYVLVAPTQYYEDVIVLHEMVHQFHFLARTDNQNVPSWYSEGSAELLSRHDWDLECLRLGRIPVLSQEDSYLDARAEIDASGVDLAGIVSESVGASRPVAMAIMQYLKTEDPEGYDAYRDAMDAHTGDPVGDFEAMIGPLDATAAAIEGWIGAHQEPMEPIYLEWIHRTPDTVETLFVNGVNSVARVKRTGDFSMTMVPISDPWIGGLLLSWQDSSNYATALADSGGSVSIFEVIGGAVSWYDIGVHPGLTDGRLAFALTHTDYDAEFTVGGEPFVQALLQPPSGGLAVYDADLEFTDIALP